MIVKFHARGKGGGSGPVDYLLGRERNREGATVLQGNPEEVRELIDATPFAKKYTSGVLSFAEKELPPGGREKVMASFERVLMPGLEKNQYGVLRRNPRFFRYPSFKPATNVSRSISSLLF